VNDFYLENSRSPNKKTIVLESSVSLSTIILVGLLYRHHSIKNDIENTDAVFPKKFFWQTKRLQFFLLEFLINIIHLPPKTNFDFQMNIMDKNITYSLLDLVSICMATR